MISEKERAYNKIYNKRYNMEHKEHLKALKIAWLEKHPNWRKEYRHREEVKAKAHEY